MTDFVLEAELREELGRSNTRRLRKAGKLPAIIYGGDKPDLPITLDYNETAKIMLRDEAFYTSMLEIKVAGKRGKNTVLLKETQWDSIYDTPMHLDFFRVKGSDQVEIEVPVTLINEEKAPGVIQGGMIDTVRRHIEVMCRADSIPEEIIIDCANLDIGDGVHILDIVLPEGVTVPEVTNVADDEEPVNFTVVTCVPPTVEEAPDEDEVEAGEVQAEHGSAPEAAPETEEGEKED